MQNTVSTTNFSWWLIFLITSKREENFCWCKNNERHLLL